MGRTVPSYRMLLESEIRDWKRFSDFLRPDEREAFEALMTACRIYASYSGAACRPIPAEAMFMAMHLSHQMTLKQLQLQIEELKAQLQKAGIAASPQSDSGAKGTE